MGEPTRGMATAPVVIGTCWSLYKYKKLRREHKLMRRWLMCMSEQDLKPFQRMACNKLCQLHFPSDHELMQVFSDCSAPSNFKPSPSAGPDSTPLNQCREA